MASTIALTVRVVCLSSTRWPTVSGASATWQTVAVTSRVSSGASATGAIRSPRETSTSSARRTVTDCGAQAMSVGSPSASIAATVLRCPDGSTTTSSPTRSAPEAICPA